jgi:hypothetical protein
MQAELARAGTSVRGTLIHLFLLAVLLPCSPNFPHVLTSGTPSTQRCLVKIYHAEM